MGPTRPPPGGALHDQREPADSGGEVLRAEGGPGPGAAPTVADETLEHQQELEDRVGRGVVGGAGGEVLHGSELWVVQHTCLRGAVGRINTDGHRFFSHVRVQREVLKYLTHYVPWYGPLYLAHTKLEHDYGSPIEAFSIVEKGLKE